MLVKASVRQASVAHHSGNRRAVQPFGPDAPRGVFHNLLMDLDFMSGPVTHDSIGCCESSQDATRQMGLTGKKIESIG